MTRAARITGAVLIVLSCTTIGSAHAQDTGPVARLDEEACARHLYERLAPLARGRHDGTRQERIVMRAIAGAEACGLPDAWRDVARRHARGLTVEASIELLTPLAEAHPQGECRTEDRLGFESYVHYDCRPAHPAVRELVVSLGLERSFSLSRAFLVLVIDALTASSPRLVGAAQVLWTFANWDFRCVPSRFFGGMRDDLRSRTVRFEPYGPRAR